MYRIDLLDFLRTGEFGPVKIGMTREQVVHELGTPTDVSSDAEGSIYLYGSVEMGFIAGRLKFIHLHRFRDRPHGTRTCHIISDGFRKWMSLKDAKSLLHEHGIDFNEKKDPWNPGQLLITRAGVELYFDKKDRDGSIVIGLEMITSSESCGSSNIANGDRLDWT